MRKRNHSIFHTLFLIFFSLYASSPLLYKCGYKDFFGDTDVTADSVRELYFLTAKDNDSEPHHPSPTVESVVFSNRINGFRLFFADFIISKLSRSYTGDKSSEPITILLKKKRCTLSAGHMDISKHPAKEASTISGSLADYKTRFMVMAHIDAPKFKKGFSPAHSGLSPPAV